jgi:hypothetical protein
MAKKTKMSKFEVIRRDVQFFTMAAAVLAGIAWLVSSVVGESDALTRISDILIILTVIGGVTMGTLYAVKSLKLKK